MTSSRMLQRAVLAALVSFSSAPLQAAVAVKAPVSATRAAAKHMLFKVRGPNGATVYLLGSVHLLNAEAGKLPPEVDSAFAHASVVAFETSIDSVQMRAQEMLGKARYADGATLKSSLTPSGLAKADSVVRAFGLSLDQLNGFKPWFVSLALSQLVMQKAGFQPQYGVDIQLNQRAKTANKPVIGLEGVDVQLNLFDRISPADQERMITGVKGPDDAMKELLRIKDAWASGDVAALEKVYEDSQSETPAMRAIVLDDRTASWMPRIEEMVRGKSDALVVVGAAHLIGKKGLIELLRAKGYQVEQL